MRKMFFPVTRETIKSLFKTELKCTECTQVKELPKITVHTKKILQLGSRAADSPLPADFSKTSAARVKAMRTADLSVIYLLH